MMYIRTLLTVSMLACALVFQAANQKQTVSQVSTTIELTTDVDYVVNGETPFGDEGMVNIVKTDHAVLILEKLKPSKVIGDLLAAHVQINGQVARNNVNCQVRLYGTRGSMILPYSTSDKPLTVYSEQNFGGESCNSFGLENDGGYMVTLTDAKLNNRIRSFRLKRGYMVTFATGKSGYGYQRCFIANSEDLEMAELPTILDNKITSYRIFKWNTAGKKGLASNTSSDACDALNVISCYGWDTGHDMYPDVECVPNHIYEDYPSSAACGRATWAGHMKTNNEPRNSSDDKPQSLNTILDNWQNLMRTGMRLCSPSSWDGSDYTDGSGFIKQFLDSIDARGWRCDLVDLHCYWLIDNFNNLSTMQSKYKRPLWISEWIWGASWNKNGAFENGKTEGDIAWAVEQICNKLNSYGFVERYFYWNSETKGKVYDNGSVTSQVGKYYANMLSGMGYNKSYEKIPNTPRMRGGFTNFRVQQEDGKATISWHEYDGEYNQLMEVLRKEPGQPWQLFQTVKPDDGEADYLLTDEQSPEGTRYRLHIVSYSGREYFSSEDMEPGEAIETTAGVRYVGGNLLHNGDFQMGTDGWTDGTGKPLSQPWFQVLPKGLTDGWFLQCYANQGKTGDGSILTAVEVEPNQDYVIRVGCCNAGEYLKVDLRQKGATNDQNKATLQSSNYWSVKQAVFNSGDNNEALLSFRWLAGTAQLGDIELRRLYPTEAEAIANGQVLDAQRADLLKPYTEAREQQLVDSLLKVANAISEMAFKGQDELKEAIAAANSTQLKQALANFLDMQESEVQPQNASFDDTKGWLTKTGTYTQGDQRIGTHQNKTCWNAWWSGLKAEQGTQQTMAIEQHLGGLPEGLYSIECKALTQHYCLSDQHAFIRTNGTAPAPFAAYAETPQLQRDYLDVPNTISAWQTLTSTPVYISGETDSLIIGFTGSKQGAIDYAWRTYGDNSTDGSNKGDLREGWWCATDFRLLYHPIFRFTATPNQWGTICLPYGYPVPKNMKLYNIAGLTADYLNIALEEIDSSEAQAGMPYIFRTTDAAVTYYTAGEPVKNASTGPNNLRGYLKNSVSVPAGIYLLNNGQWQRTTQRETPASYSAVIRSAKGITILSEWQGLTMPIQGALDELGDPAGITQHPSPSTQHPAPNTQHPTPNTYDLQGRSRTNSTANAYKKGRKGTTIIVK